MGRRVVPPPAKGRASIVHYIKKRSQLDAFLTPSENNYQSQKRSKAATRCSELARRHRPVALDEANFTPETVESVRAWRSRCFTPASTSQSVLVLHGSPGSGKTLLCELAMQPVRLVTLSGTCCRVASSLRGEALELVMQRSEEVILLVDNADALSTGGEQSGLGSLMRLINHPRRVAPVVLTVCDHKFGSTRLTARRTTKMSVVPDMLGVLQRTCSRERLELDASARDALLHASGSDVRTMLSMLESACFFAGAGERVTHSAVQKAVQGGTVDRYKSDFKKVGDALSGHELQDTDVDSRVLGAILHENYLTHGLTCIDAASQAIDLMCLGDTLQQEALTHYTDDILREMAFMAPARVVALSSPDRSKARSIRLPVYISNKVKRSQHSLAAL